jgi:hypothetical protein
MKTATSRNRPAMPAPT